MRLVNLILFWKERVMTYSRSRADVRGRGCGIGVGLRSKRV